MSLSPPTPNDPDHWIPNLTAETRQLHTTNSFNLLSTPLRTHIHMTKYLFLLHRRLINRLESNVRIASIWCT